MPALAFLSAAQPLVAAGSFVPWGTAILCAALGVIGTAWYFWYRRQREFVELLMELRSEIEAIRQLCDERLSTPGSINIDPPLPTEAWQLIVASGQLGTVTSSHQRSLREFYSAVVSANYIAEQWAALLQISRLASDDDVRGLFDRLAEQARTKPFKVVQEQTDAIASGVDGEIRRLDWWLQCTGDHC